MATTDFLWDDDEFDDEFFKEVDKLEELATSLTQNRQPPKPSSSTPAVSLPPLPLPPPQKPPPPALISALYIDYVSYSPPRELSQRFPLLNDGENSSPSSNNRSAQPPITQEQLEIERLKGELGQVSKQLSDLKQECSELKKERDRNKQLKSVYPTRESLVRNSEAVILHPAGIGISAECENVTEQKQDKGAENESGCARPSGAKDIVDENGSARASTSGTTSTDFGNPELLAIWSSERLHRSRSFAAKLLETCATDFCSLFRFLSSNMTSKIEIKHLSLAAFPGNSHCLQSAEAMKISKLYSVLSQLSNDMVHVDALVEILLDLCNLENALIVHRSLRILHVALDHLLSIDRRRPKRDNVKVEKLNSGSDAVHNHDSSVRKSGGKCDISKADTSGSYYIAPCKLVGIPEHENNPLLRHVDWVHLYESMCQIAVRLMGEHARMEAVSIMNLILLTTDAYSEREQFGGTLVFEAVALLLRKEAGYFCRQEAVHLVHLLLNCKTAVGHLYSKRKRARGRGAYL